MALILVLSLTAHMYYLYVRVVPLSEVRPTAVLLVLEIKKAYSNHSPSVPTVNTDYQKTGMWPYRERVTPAAVDQAAG